MRAFRLLLVLILLLTTMPYGLVSADDSSNLKLNEDEQSSLNEMRKESQLQDNLLFLKRLEDEYNYAKSGFNQVNQTLSDTKSKLREVHSEGSSLKQELFYLDQAIDISHKKLVAISNQLAKKSNLIDLLEADINEQREINEHQKEFISDYFNFLYRQQQNLFSSKDQELEAFKFLLGDNSASEVMQESEYFALLHVSAEQTMEKIAKSESALQEAQEKLETEKLIIIELQKAQESEENQLNSQKEFKQNLLEQTKGEEAIYKELLEKAKIEQEEARNELLLIKDNLDVIKKQMDKLGSDFDPAQYKDLLNKGSKEVYEFYLSAANRGSVDQMAWPVIPLAAKGISAYFRDESYHRWAGIPHNAIDIPTPQNTTIRSPLECVTYKVKDNGFGYSYVILACKGGYLLTFGHISEFIAKEGDKLQVGQPVALTGGAPGTKGAGHLTTGAHLHFEVMKDGQYKDPLDFLDLSLLPYDRLPEKYQARIKAQLEERIAVRKKKLQETQ